MSTLIPFQQRVFTEGGDTLSITKVTLAAVGDSVVLPEGASAAAAIALDGGTALTISSLTGIAPGTGAVDEGPGVTALTASGQAGKNYAIVAVHGGANLAGV